MYNFIFTKSSSFLSKMVWQKQQDPLFSSFLYILPIFLLTILYLHQRRSRRPFPPGPRPFPLIGNILMANKLTHRRLAELSMRYGGMFYLRLGRLHNVVVSTPEMAKQVLHKYDVLFANRPITFAINYLTYDRSNMAFAQYGPFWRKMRKLSVVKLFSRRRVESWASVRCEIAKLVRDIAKQTSGRVEIGELLFILTKCIIFSAAFGQHSNEKEKEMLAITHEFSELFGAVTPGDCFPWLSWLDFGGLKKRLKRARLSLDRVIESIIDDHRANPKPPDSDETDMVDEMLAFLRESDDGSATVGRTSELDGDLNLTINNIKAIVMDIMFGGTETIASLMEWAFAELMRSPEEMKRVQEELEEVVGLRRRVDDNDLVNLVYLKCAVKEALRLHPSIPIIPRETTADCEINGFYIPAGARIMVNAWAIGRDRSVWRDADVFRPSRFLPGQGEAADVDFYGSFFEFVPFGSGRRSCPGLQLGVYATELALAELLHCFVWELPGGMKPSDLNMDDVAGLTAPRAVRLAAVPTWRLTCHAEL